ncbi:MAG TPA: MgtC/SapB family protein [Firmicutes bacterium]|nr:MgtC/SapB family protein [Bacillota bacterium]
MLVAVLLGFAIGYERKLRYKEAGIRTHTIVCAGSALMMLVSKYGFGGEDADASRVAAQIVAGVGFLGAGIIVYRKHEVHGLTTAAGVWATAGVGMAAGAGLYLIAAGATVILIGVQCLFHIKCKFFQTKKYFQVKICFVSDGDANDTIKELFQTDRFYRLVIERKGGEAVYHATLNTDQEYSSQRLGEIMARYSFIRSIERCDEA